MKTAIQELIDWIAPEGNAVDTNSLLEKCNELLTIEKEQIVKAYDDGFDSVAIGSEYYENEYIKSQVTKNY